MRGRSAIASACLLIAACTSAAPRRSAPATRAVIVGSTPRANPLLKVRRGMGYAQVVDLVGQPDDTSRYLTANAWLPIYFGNDVERTEFHYKKLGRVVFTGPGYFDHHVGVVDVVVDPSEPGTAR